jgi:uncharacterized Ntn-hydrolase superfamily protein
MTMSFVVADDTGFGIAIASSSPAVAARCAHLRSGVGAVATQNVTDPRLGRVLLDELSRGRGPTEAIETVVRTFENIEYRQLTVLSARGGGHFTGANGLGLTHAVEGDRVVGAGNMLADQEVITSAVRAFERSSGDLERRLLVALETAVEHGGEEGPLRSAGLMVSRRNHDWNETDLRVDWDEVDPIAELEALLDRWLVERDDYVTRALHPDRAPTYGVPGDL